LTEIHVERAGVGELHLVMPAAARLTRSGRWLALVAPPYVPYAPALSTHGVLLSRLMLVNPATAEDGLWACEHALRSQACAAVLAWFDRVPDRSLRRLQLAAESGGAVMMMFRPARAAPASPAALRLYVGKSQSRTLVRILKRRGGGLPAPVALDLHGTSMHVREARRAVPGRVRLIETAM
jgi:cell division inhibitor SulA/protein ImuA